VQQSPDAARKPVFVRPVLRPFVSRLTAQPSPAPALVPIEVVELDAGRVYKSGERRVRAERLKLANQTAHRAAQGFAHVLEHNLACYSVQADDAAGRQMRGEFSALRGEIRECERESWKEWGAENPAFFAAQFRGDRGGALLRAGSNRGADGQIETAAGRILTPADDLDTLNHVLVQRPCVLARLAAFRSDDGKQGGRPPFDQSARLLVSSARRRWRQGRRARLATLKRRPTGKAHGAGTSSTTSYGLRSGKRHTWAK
jgi:hypothetical protein